jgi:hypothetical protein
LQTACQNEFFFEKKLKTCDFYILLTVVLVLDVNITIKVYFFYEPVVVLGKKVSK